LPFFYQRGDGGEACLVLLSMQGDERLGTMRDRVAYCDTDALDAKIKRQQGAGQELYDGRRLLICCWRDGHGAGLSMPGVCRQIGVIHAQ
jgi:hypothetical protein